MRKSLVIPDYPRGTGKTSVIANGKAKTKGPDKDFQKSKSSKNKKKQAQELENSTSELELGHLPTFQSDDLFKSSKSTPKSKTKKTKKSLKLSAEETSILAEGNTKEKVSIVPLNFTSITEGLLSLGRIEVVRDSEILVSLPGRMIGSVPITAISTPYTKVLEKLAEGGNVEDAVYGVGDLFSPGQVVSVAVMNVDSSSGKSTRLSLSLNPKDIHANYKAEDLFETLVLTGAIESQEDHGYVVDLGITGASAFLPLDGARGFIKGPNGGKPLGIGQLIPVRIKSMKYTKGKSFAELTATPQEITSPQYTLAEISSPRLLLPGMKSEATVMESLPTGLKVDFLDQQGEIHVDHLPEPWSPPESFDISTSLRPRVLYIRPFMSTPALTLQSKLCSSKWSKIHSPAHSDSVRLGETYKAKVRRWEARGVIIELIESGARGIVSSTRCSDDSSCTREDLMKKFPVNSKHVARVLEYSSIDNLYIASFQQSILSMDIVRVDQLSIGQVVNCQLLKWKQGGAIVLIGKVKGFIPTIHFGDGKLSNPNLKYPVGSKLKARVFQLDLTRNQLKLTAKKKLVESDGALLASWNQYIEPGTIADGLVSRVSPQGINVFTLGGLAGFIPKSKAIQDVQGHTINPESIFYPGQVLRFSVLNVNPEKKRLILTLFINNAKEAGEESKKSNGSLAVKDSTHEKKNRKRKTHEPEPIQEIIEVSEGENEEELMPKKKSKKSKKKIQKSTVEEEEILEGENKEELKPKKKSKKSKKKTQTTIVKEAEVSFIPPVLHVAEIHSKPTRKRKISELSDHSDSCSSPTKLLPKKRKSPQELPSLEESFAGAAPASFFNFVRNGKVNSAAEDFDDELSSSEDENEKSKSDEKTNGKISKISKANKAKAREQEIRKFESQLADAEATPQSIQDFERLVLASPNSSMAWTAYISFLLQLADIENARKVGRRALATILFRETQEIENVWKVLLRMEGMFGTEEELQTLFKEAVRANDELPMYWTLCEIYDHHSKTEELSKLFNTMSKKFKENVKVWNWIIGYYYRKGQLDLGREWFKSGLAALQHNNGGGTLSKKIELISRTAVLEFNWGDAERGKTILDSTLESHPKRLDLWILYAKQLIKKGMYDEAREVFLRSTSVPFPPKRMSQLLKDFLAFETLHGTPKTKEQVKEIALKYVKNIDVHL